MTWAYQKWLETFSAMGFYKGNENAMGEPTYLSQDVQLKYDVGAIVEGRVDVLDPDLAFWKIDICLPGYQESWKASKGDTKIFSTYVLGDHAAQADSIKLEKPLLSVEDFAKFATEYLHELDLRPAYSAFRQAMRHF
jgi:hypothetical protein